ncbi:DeoR/GlpR family DNA-binding transcription regulator [Allonocardiopsis opalescens]|uniref:Lactose phosphotransferase system repressor n=1 Tax=Allonocardiopsis opalescens TaxID=1144618 RepID=A0A2T0PXD5_9ACTN|nr:DeoR/GlpR family DNA-binding transcription regulator [Allonocardiopsis opalescens]PRX96191.1 DeoR family transcriptional regulator [Allonocardiopsis opalescens]
MDSSERLRTIIDVLQTVDRVTVAELSDRTGSSEMTIRRDLEQLAVQGVVKRVRGGAISLLLRGEEAPFALRQGDAADAKRRIAAEVDALVSDGEAVLLDAGTTCLEVARTLAGRRLTVMPLSLHGASVLSAEPATQLLLPGGEVRPGEQSFVGHMTEAAVRSLRFDTAVIGSCGISPEDGLMYHHLPEVAIKQAAIDSSRRVIVAADASKFQRTAFGRVCDIRQVDAVVTDAHEDNETVVRLRAAGITVRCV